MNRGGSFRALAILVTVFGMGSAVHASAQDSPRAEIGVGYQFFRVEGESFKLGFNADVAVPVNGPRSVIGEFSWTRRSGTVDEDESVDFSESATGFGGGVRYNHALDDMRTVYGQAVVGIQRTGGTITVDAFDFEDSESSSDFMLGLDGGVQFRINEMLNGFGQVGIRRVFFEGEGSTGVRIVAGIRVDIM